MKLILTADVDKLGAPGDIVEVKGGYGRNFLLPRGLAIVATRGAERQVESIKRAQEAREVRDSDHANELKQKLESLADVKVAVKTSDAGKLFGSVTAGDVASAIKAATSGVTFVSSQTTSILGWRAGSSVAKSRSSRFSFCRPARSMTCRGLNVASPRVPKLSDEPMPGTSPRAAFVRVLVAPRLPLPCSRRSTPRVSFPTR